MYDAPPPPPSPPRPLDAPDKQTFDAGNVNRLWSDLKTQETQVNNSRLFN